MWKKERAYWETYTRQSKQCKYLDLILDGQILATRRLDFWKHPCLRGLNLSLEGGRRGVRIELSKSNYSSIHHPAACFQVPLWNTKSFKTWKEDSGNWQPCTLWSFTVKSQSLEIAVHWIDEAAVGWKLEQRWNEMTICHNHSRDLYHFMTFSVFSLKSCLIGN